MEKATITIENEDGSKRTIFTITDAGGDWDINIRFDPPVDKEDNGLYSSITGVVINAFTE